MRVAICSLLLFLVGCTSPRQRTVADLETVAPGDSLVIVVTNRENMEIRGVVDASGHISMPYAVKLRMAGKTLLQAAETIESAYLPCCFQEPIKVSVTRLSMSN